MNKAVLLTLAAIVGLGVGCGTTPTTGQGNGGDPPGSQVARANGKIAYVTHPVGTTEEEIWTVNPDGTGAARLTNGLAPAWSPDGTKIAFIRRDSTQDGVTGLYVANADGSDETRIVDGSGSVPTFSVGWSPDGNTLVYGAITDPASVSDLGARFLATGSGCYGEIRAIGVDGSNPRSLTSDDPAAADAFPAWSPDGKSIAFLRVTYAELTGGGAAQGVGGLYVMDADGSNMRRIGSFPIAAMDEYGFLGMMLSAPSWSPDSSKLACLVLGPEQPDVGTAIVDVATGHYTALPLMAFGACWSPDGTKIAYLPLSDGSGEALYTMAADGTDQAKLLDSHWNPMELLPYVSWQSAPAGGV